MDDVGYTCDEWPATIMAWDKLAKLVKGTIEPEAHPLQRWKDIDLGLGRLKEVDFAVFIDIDTGINGGADAGINVNIIARATCYPELSHRLYIL